MGFMLANICTCVSGFGAGPCPVHLPDYTHRAIEAAAARDNAVVDKLARDPEATATRALKIMADQILWRLPEPLRGVIQEVWTEFAPVVVQQATVRAQSIATQALDAMRALVLESVEHDPGLTVLIERIWENLAPVAIEQVVVRAQSIAVIDERGPGSLVDLVDERG